MKLSILFSETRDVDRAIALIVAAERRCFHGAFLGAAFGFDPITVLALAGTRTERILLGTAVVPTWPRHPVVMAQQAATAHAASGGRFRLGIGPSHVPVIEGMYGLDFERPLRHLREFFAVLRPLLRDGEVAYDGELYRVHAPLQVVGRGDLPILVSALGEQLSRFAGRHADGVIPWLAPPQYVSEQIRPNVEAGAAAAGRSAPPIIAAIPCALSTDADAVRAIVRRRMGMYLTMPFYRSLLERAEVPDAANGAPDGWTDAMVDAVIPYGSQESLAETIRTYARAGADEVALQPIGVGDDPERSVERTYDALADIARDLGEPV